MPHTAVYFKHGIGNLVMMTPAIRALASMDADRKVDVFMSAGWQDARRPAFDAFFAACDFVGRVVNYPTDKFDASKYTRWFYTGHSEASDALDLFRSKNPLTEGLPDWHASHIHEIDYYMQLARKLGYTGETPHQYAPVQDRKSVV